MACGFPFKKLFLPSFLFFFYLIICSEGKPRSWKETEGNVTLPEARNTHELNSENISGEEFHDRTIQIESLSSGISSMISCVTNSLSAILGNITSNAGGGLGNLTSLFKKPSSGIGGGLGNLTSIFSKPSGGIGGGCDKLDPLLIANIPGIFFWTPIVILAVSILVGVVAAIIIAIGGLGHNITDSIYDMIKEKMNQGGYGESTSSSYGEPVSSYGSPSSYSRLTDSVDLLTDNFSQAYDKYSALNQQTPYQTEQPQKQQIFKDYYENQSQYDRWNQIAKARRG